jgi:glycosyltransferase involved in cell wall biosynthesis
MTLSPGITVLIPAYRAQATIARALASVRAQTLQPEQILIIDDGSPEPLSVETNQAGSTPLSLVRLSHNLGSSGALNHGIAQIETQWIAFLDADDSWHPEKLALQMAYAERHSDSVLIATGLRFLNATGHSAMDVATTALPVPHDDRLASLMEDCVIGKPTVLVRTNVVKSIGGFDTKLIVGEDQHLWLRIAAKHRVDILPDILTFAHDTPGSLTKRTDIAPDHLWRKVIAPLLEQHQHRFSPAQRRKIVGARCQQAAIAHMERDSLSQAFDYLVRSLLSGYQPVQNIYYMLTPLKRWIKRVL